MLYFAFTGWDVQFPACRPCVILGFFNIRIAADSTMLRMVNLLIALSFGVHREQLLHRIGLTWPRPFLFRPLSCISANIRLRTRCNRRKFVEGMDDISEKGKFVLGCALLNHFD